MIETLTLLMMSLGFVLFISRSLGVRTPRARRKQRGSRPTLRLALALLAFALLLTLAVALSIRWIWGLLERTLT